MRAGEVEGRNATHLTHHVDRGEGGGGNGQLRVTGNAH